MTTSIPAYIGSTIKFTGGVALLHLFESKNKYINPSGRSVDNWLDMQVYFFFPKVWQEGMHPSVKKITFRHLLQHRSGLRNLGSGEEYTGDKAQSVYDYLVKGVLDKDFGQWAYANANIQLLSYLIPMIADPTLLNTVNMEIAKQKLKADDLAIRVRIANAWEEYMRGAKFYGKITPAIAPSCNPTVEFPNQNRVWAYDYKSVNDAGKGGTRDSRNNNGHCHAQGGWYITARELAAFVANFNATETLVSAETRGKMFDDDKSGERLVWSFTISDPVIQNKFNYSALPYMGGDHFGAHATILMLPNGYYAIGIINSNDMNSGAVTRRLLEAFKSGIGSA